MINIILINTTLILGLLETNASAEKEGPKQDAVGLHDLNSIKIIFELLAEVVTIHM